jgi:hypothetical protein
MLRHLPKESHRNMQPGPVLTFRHILLPEKIWKSVCMACFRTAAEADEEDELAPRERMHVCKGLFD